MLLRTGLGIAGHAASGFAMGVLGVLAACTVAQTLAQGAKMAAKRNAAPDPVADPFRAPPPNSAPTGDGPRPVD